jgi:hypothetical protein
MRVLLMVAAYAILFGILLMVFGFRVRSWGDKIGLLAGSAS